VRCFFTRPLFGAARFVGDGVTLFKGGGA
jgi:hypothetical protein